MTDFRKSQARSALRLFTWDVSRLIPRYMCKIKIKQDELHCHRKGGGTACHEDGALALSSHNMSHYSFGTSLSRQHVKFPFANVTQAFTFFISALQRVLPLSSSIHSPSWRQIQANQRLHLVNVDRRLQSSASSPTRLSAQLSLPPTRKSYLRRQAASSVPTL